MKRQHIKDLLYPSLETERAAAAIYAAAIRCADSKDLKAEWETNLSSAKDNKRALRKVLEKLDLDPSKKTAARRIIAYLGDSLVTTMNMARKAGDKKAAQGIASECVVFIESKHEFNWALMAEMASDTDDAESKAIESLTNMESDAGHGPKPKSAKSGDRQKGSRSKSEKAVAEGSDGGAPLAGSDAPAPRPKPALSLRTKGRAKSRTKKTPVKAATLSKMKTRSSATIKGDASPK